MSTRATRSRAAEFDHRDCKLCEDIYAFDPAENDTRLLWLVITARAEAIEERSVWR